MKTIYLEIEEKQDKQYKQIQNTHLWYDLEEKKLKVLQGGFLRFNYNLSKIKMIPHVEDTKITLYNKTNNREVIFLWLKKYINLININKGETTSKSIAIDVEDSDEAYVLDLISREGFRYD